MTGLSFNATQLRTKLLPKLLIICLLIFLQTDLLSYSFKLRHVSSYKRGLRLMESPKEKDNVFTDATAVNSVLDEISSILEPLRGKGRGVESNVTLFDIQSQFNQLFESVRSSSISDPTKREVFAEGNLLIRDALQTETDADADTEFRGKGIVNGGSSGSKKKGMIVVDKPATAVYSARAGPTVLVHGTGLVGQRVLSIAQELGKAASFRYINASLLSTMQESEINFAVRGARSIIIAADEAAVEKKGWFGQTEMQQPPDAINAKGLKRLLNAAFKEQAKDSTTTTAATATSKQPLKVVAMGRACRQQKSMGAFIGGDNTEFESEVILQCQQRGLSYNIVNMGRIITDDELIPASVRTRSVNKDADSSSSSSGSARAVFEPPFVFTSSKIIESSECTKLSVAAEALMRFTVHPHRNVTISVLSNPLAATATTTTAASSAASTTSIAIAATADAVAARAALVPDWIWQDEFLKVDGPELLRFPLRFASTRQALQTAQRIVTSLQQRKKSGLVTPIEVEVLDNGIRVLFRPLSSDYVSSKDEKLLLEQMKAAEKISSGGSGSSTTTTAAVVNAKRPGGYLSPEEEKRIAVALAAAEDAASAPAQQQQQQLQQLKKKKSLPEGGVEIIVEESPVPRVRVRRCNMGPKTVLKLESEALIIKTLQRGLLQLDNDYRSLSDQYDAAAGFEVPL